MGTAALGCPPERSSGSFDVLTLAPQSAQPSNFARSPGFQCCSSRAVVLGVSLSQIDMPQDRQSGLKASRYGKECARRIAAAIGAEMTSRKSNECIWNGTRAIIKCAHLRTTSVGVLYHMTKELEIVLGAFQQADESYRVIQLPIGRCTVIMNARPTRSRGPSANRVGMIPRAVFEVEGKLIGAVRIQEP